MSTVSSIESLARPTPDARAPAAAIQPLGFLLVVSREWLVERASANVADFFGQEANAVIGRPLIELLGADAVHSLRNQLALLRSPLGVARLFGCTAGKDGDRFDFALQPDGQRVLVEGLRAGPAEHGDTIATVRALIDRLERLPDLEQLLDSAARQLRALTGFDRVAIYRLDEDGAAALAAQAARTLAGAAIRLEAADCAVPAAGLAVIGDRSAPPVPIHPPGKFRGEPLLGAPGEAQCNKLEACGAAAGLTLPLTVGGKPWGLVLCHHPSPRFPEFERQSAIGLFAQMLALLIALRERAA